MVYVGVYAKGDGATEAEGAAVAAGCVVVLPLFVRMICGLGLSVF